ncbi:12896_t:CDS:2 [Entrophospora sp. SA101]|nr:12896_t:CDS:2 [Entrophospora sp. SA101]
MPGNAISRNEDGGDVIKYLYTIYHPLDESIKRYVPDINNSKFYMNDENILSLSVSMVGFSTIEPKINTKGTSVEIAMIENVGQDKNSKQINKQFKIVIFHPFESRLSSITKSCKNVSRLFISGHLSPQRKNLAKEFFLQEENQQQIQLPNQNNHQNQLPNNQPTQQQLQLTNQTNNQPSLQQQPQQFQQEPEFQQSKPQQKSQQQFQQELELQQSTELPSQPTNQSVKQQVQSSNAKKKNQTF